MSEMIEKMYATMAHLGMAPTTYRFPLANLAHATDNKMETVMSNPEITVASIRAKIAEDLELSRQAREQGLDRQEREDWFPIRRMSDEEIQRAIDAGFGWTKRMDEPFDPDAPFDLADMTDDEIEAFANGRG